MHYRFKIKNRSHLHPCKQFLKAAGAIGIYEIEEGKTIIVGCFCDGDLKTPAGTELLSKEKGEVNWDDQWDQEEVLVTLKDISFKLKPGSGFGDARHPTTLLCLEALANHPLDSVVDIGSGSGVLSLASHFLRAKKVIPIEIDDLAILHHQENCKLNQVPIQIVKKTLKDEDIDSDEHFFVMNMILSEQKEVLKSCPKLFEFPGYWYVSGILKEGLNTALEFYTSMGLLIERIDHKEIWAGILMKRS